MIVIDSQSRQPIYEQICTQIKNKILSGELRQEEMLPSVRTFAKELRVSALTVKKAYDALEEEGFAITIHGKGTYITAANTELLLEEQKKETLFRAVIASGRIVEDVLAILKAQDQKKEQ